VTASGTSRQGADVSEGVDMQENTDEDMGVDVQRAAGILAEARNKAQHQLRIRYPALFVTWGLMYLLGYGSLWLSVRGQRPYQGPTSAGLLALTVIVAAALAITVVLVGRAVSGIGGSSALQRRVYVLASIAGFIGLLTLEAALDHAGASRAVLGVYGAAAPVLLTGVIYAAVAAIWLDWAGFGLGLWLIVVGAGSGFAGPATVWAVEALAAGGAFLVTAAFRLKQRS
jgi:hypothetical protein